jgi:hypothetical protein
MATIENIKEFLEEIENLESNNNLFFRVHEDETYLLEPGVYRKDNTTKKNLIEHEDVIYREVISKAPQDFSGKNTLESLALMQHYGVPTRILDLTESALVALYFACSNSKNDDKHGEVIVFDIPTESVKYYNSDRVTILANLAKCEKDFNYNKFIIDNKISEIKKLEKKKIDTKLYDKIRDFDIDVFTFLMDKNEEIIEEFEDDILFKNFDENLKKYMSIYDKKFTIKFDAIFINSYVEHIQNHIRSEINKEITNANEMYFGKLLHNIREDKSYFDAIINPLDLPKVFAVKPKLDNPRIVRQHGAFLIFGIKETHFVGFGDYKPMAELNTDWILRGNPHKERIIIDKDSKDKIRKELNTLGFNQSTLFPEIDKVAEYVRDKYK